MKRILSIDGGGIRGIFALQILKKVELKIAEKHGKALHEYFDFIAGTSTGSIIATLLSWGYTAVEIENFYRENADKIFAANKFYRRFFSRFRADHLSRLLQEILSEKDGQPAQLGTERLKTLLLIITRNASTGSPWPLCNNPQGKYNNRDLPDCNLNLPLWQIVRASTAAPTFFQPEKLPLGKNDFWFIDGGVSAYNNPSFIAFLFASLPEYHINWATGEDKLLLISVGTGSCRKPPFKKTPDQMHLLDQVACSFELMINSLSTHEDLLCRLWGNCLCGELIDSEIGDQKSNAILKEKLFSYARYDHTFPPEEAMHPKYGNLLATDNLNAMRFLQDAGTSFADKTVHKEHLL